MKKLTNADLRQNQRELNAEKWAREVIGWKDSGLSGPAYAALRGYPVTTLYWWGRAGRRRKIASDATSKGTLAATTPDSPKPLKFLPVVVRPSGTDRKSHSLRVQAEIVLRGGRSVRLLGEMEISDLPAVLRAVEGGVSC